MDQDQKEWPLNKLFFADDMALVVIFSGPRNDNKIEKKIKTVCGIKSY